MLDYLFIYSLRNSIFEFRDPIETRKGDNERLEIEGESEIQEQERASAWWVEREREREREINLVVDFLTFFLRFALVCVGMKLFGQFQVSISEKEEIFSNNR